MIRADKGFEVDTVPTWLILEDDEDIPDMLVWMFNSMGVDSKAFRRGEDLLFWVEQRVEAGLKWSAPELALIDIRLTGLVSGIDVASRLRRFPGLENITIVLMTAYRLNSDDEQRILRLSGADSILLKPLPRKKELYAILSTAVKSRIIQNDTL